VWLYIAGWTLFSSEMGAAFAPEYKNAKRDVPRVLMLSAIFMMFTYLAPLSATAELGAKTVVQNPLTFAVLAANHVLGRGGPIFTIILVAALFVTTVMFTSDASRATASMAEEGDTLRQFAKQNRRGVPTWGTGVVIVINIAILLFAANPITILLASNLGYILAHCLANWSFVILRKSQPNAQRPLKLKSPLWVLLAVILGCFHLVLLYVGITHPGLAGYGGLKETLFAIGILLTGLIFWVIRVVAQDHQPLKLRDKDYTVHGESGGAPDAAHAG
jgi:amino acid transporter